MLDKIKGLIPLHDEQTERLKDRTNDMFHSVVIGNFLTAMAQGVAGAVGLWIAGLAPLFWGTMLVLSSFVPLIGMGLVFIPTIGYLLLTGSGGWSLFLVAWALGIVSPIDNYLRPVFMQSRAKVHSLTVLLARLGGMIVFGFPGLLYGPLAFGLAMVIPDFYKAEYLTS
jgi:predicted PurR-regulated permease PerM